MNDVKNKFDQLNIPIDTIWNDIDYMDRYADFTINTQNYKIDEMNALQEGDKPLHYIPIIDAGISRRSKNIINRMNELNVSIKSNYTN